MTSPLSIYHPNTIEEYNRIFNRTIVRFLKEMKIPIFIPALHYASLIAVVANWHKSLSTEKNVWCAMIYRAKQHTGDKFNDAVLAAFQARLRHVKTKLTEIRNRQIPIPGMVYNGIHLTEGVVLCEEDQLLADFYSGKYFGPWRLSELINLKYADADKENDNYVDLENKVFVLNQYKTVKTYGQVVVPIPDELLASITRLVFSQGMWRHDSYLFTNTQGKQYTESQLSTKLAGMFGVSVNKLRSLYLTQQWKLGKMETEEQRIAVTTDMRTSTSMIPNYVKI